MQYRRIRLAVPSYKRALKIPIAESVPPADGKGNGSFDSHNDDCKISPMRVNRLFGFELGACDQEAVELKPEFSPERSTGIMSRSKFHNFFLLLVAVAAFSTAVVVMTSFQASASRAQEHPGIKESTQEDRIPVARYDVPQAMDPAIRLQRQARSGRYDTGQAKTFTVAEPGGSIQNLPLNAHFWAGVAAIPASQSDAVVLGTVIEGVAHLSNDKTGVYSEFTVRVEEALKNDDRLRLNPSDLVAVEREGGTVQFPSGSFQQYRIAKQGMPQVGGRYVLFLKYNDEGQDFSIITGYRLRKGRVLPLDDVGAFTTYKDTEESSFLTALRCTIKRLSGNDSGRQAVND
jgi:hypothetical protein